jgi:hypothetical protein
MKRIFLITLVAAACSSGYKKAEDAQDAGREFIRASLDGDHKKARFYLLEDSTNVLLLKQQERNYDRLSSKEKEDRRASSIRPVEIRPLNDSITEYKYYNTYNSKDTTTLRIVKTTDSWLVDLKSIIKM